MGTPAGCPFGATGYEGPGVSFSNIAADSTSGTVNFSPAIPPGDVYTVGQKVNASYTCTPGTGATLASCTGTLPNNPQLYGEPGGHEADCLPARHIGDPGPQPAAR